MGAVLSQARGVIAQGASLSGAVYVGDKIPFAIQMPADWDAAGLTFQGSRDGSTFQNVYDGSGNELTKTAAASRQVNLDPIELAGYLWIKIRSGTAGLAVNQAAARTLYLLKRAV
jgi:hypothetical protein